MLYADDFIITGSTKELLVDEVKPLVESFLQERGLELSQTKTRITHISDCVSSMAGVERSWLPYVILLAVLTFGTVMLGDSTTQRSH